MNEQLQQDFDQAIDGFISALSNIDDSKINVVPFEGSWTAGELAQHILLSTTGIADMLNGPKEKPGRPADEKVETIRNILLDTTTKLNSPDMLVPEKKDYSKDDQLSALRKIRHDADPAVANNDMTQICKAFEFPVLGYITGVESVTFATCHLVRHTKQMEKIGQALAAA